MNNIYAICEVRLIEPYERAIGTIYRVGRIRGWRVLYASTTTDHATIGLKIDDFRKYYSQSPKIGEAYDPIKGMGKFMEYLKVVSIKDLRL